MKKFLLVAAVTMMATWAGILDSMAQQQIRMDICTIGSRTDASWSQGYYEAYQYISKKYPDVKLTFSDNNPYAEFPSILEAKCQMGKDIIYCENAWIEAVTKIGPKYPKVWFDMPGAMESQVMSIPSNNVFDYHQKWEQGAFLAGIAAGMTTKSNTLAYVAGHDYPNIIKIGVAFREGVKMVNPKAKLLVIYTGDWNDVQKGYEAAKAMIEQGADVLIHANDNAGKGVFKAARDHKASKVYVIGYTRDQIDLAPDSMITSVLMDHGRLAEQVLIDYKTGQLKKVSKGFGIKDGWPAVATLRNVSEATKAKVNEVSELIKSGKVEVPLVIEPEALTGVRSR